MEVIDSYRPPKNAYSPLFKFKTSRESMSSIIFGIDIGGSLVKLSIVMKKTETKAKDYFISKKIFEMVEEKDNYLFLTLYQTESFFMEIQSMIEEVKNFTKVDTVQATGGGAFKFKDFCKEKFNITLEKHDELISLVRGYLFFNSFNSLYKIEGINQIDFVSQSDLVFPHLAVNIGSGVSILKVDSPDNKDIHRVAGTIMGGGTLIGLSKILIGVDKYSEIIELAKHGDYRNTDYTMKDVFNIVGGQFSDDDFQVASSMAKIQEYINLKTIDKCKKEDIALSLLIIICNHIAQISCLTARQYGVKEILIFGNFSRRGSQAVFLLNQGFQYFDKSLKIRFNYYDGYSGTVGVLIEKRQ